MVALDRFFTPPNAATSSAEAIFTVLESISDAVVIIDARWHCIYLNDRAETLLRQVRSRLLDTTIWDIFPNTLGTSAEAAFRQAARTGIATVFELPFPALGTWFELRASPSPAGLVVYFHDIGARKAAEATLHFQAQLVDQVEVAVIATDIGGRVTHWNTHATTLYGWTREEALGRPIGELTVGPSDPATAAAIWARLRAGESWTGEFIARRKDGTTFPAHVTDAPVRAATGEHVGIVGVSVDLSASKLAAAERHAVEERYRTLVEQIPAVVYVNPIGDNPVPRYISPRIADLTGYTAREWLDEHDHGAAALHPDDRSRVAAAGARSAATGTPFAAEYRYRRKDGRYVWVRDEAIVLRDADGQPAYWQGCIADVTERREFEGRLLHQATHDALTGLPNRALLLDRLGQALARARRDSDHCAILFLDLDNFKDVNDTGGHDVGDRLLIAVAERLRTILRDGDTLARLGGDEFTILLERVEDAAAAGTAAERLAATLADPFQLDGREQRISASIGVVLSEPGHLRPEDALRDADVALYRAKEAGRSRYVIFDPAMQAALTERLTMERDLWTALEQGQFTLHYQPIIDLKTGETIEVEALIRWQHPTRGWLPPDSFIPVAEACGAIRPLGRWVLHEACRQGRAWLDRADDRPSITIAVNLSGREFIDPTLADTVVAALHASGFPPHLLRLEITETAAMENAEAALNTMHTLRAIGVRLTLDDFGTGYSSLAYLRQFPVDGLKIDRSFIRDLTTDRRNVEICRTIAMLAKTLRLEVVAEGIETREQVAQARGFLCDHAQGYFFSKPVPPEEITQRLWGTPNLPMPPASWIHPPRQRTSS